MAQTVDLSFASHRSQQSPQLCIMNSNIKLKFQGGNKKSLLSIWLDFLFVQVQ